MRKPVIRSILRRTHFCTAFAALFMGCDSQTQDRSTLVAKDSLELHLGFPVRSDLATMWHDPRSDSDFFVFADPTTTKQLVFSTHDGELSLAIPLDSALEQISEVDAMCVLSKDSIWLMPAHQNRLLLINGSGQVVRKVLFDPCSTTSSGDHYEFSASAQAHFCASNKFVFSAYFKSNINDTTELKTQPRLRYMRTFYSTVNSKYHMAYVQLGKSNNCNAIFGIDSFYYQLSSEPFHSIEANHYVVNGDSVLIFSSYSDRISIADVKELKVRRTVPVRSLFTPTGIPPPVIDQKEADSGGKNLNHRFATEGYIQNLVRDMRTGQYMVVVYHQVPLDSPPEKSKTNRPFSIIVFDKDFTHQVREYAFTDIRYDGFCILPTRNGFYMKRHEDKQTKAGGTHTFDLFVLDEE